MPKAIQQHPAIAVVAIIVALSMDSECHLLAMKTPGVVYPEEE
jgi:hypothetical protein